MVVRRNRRRAAPLVCSHAVAETRTRAGLSMRGRHSFVTPCVPKAKSPARLRRSRLRLRPPGQLINQGATFEACRTVKAARDPAGGATSLLLATSREADTDPNAVVRRRAAQVDARGCSRRREVSPAVLCAKTSVGSATTLTSRFTNRQNSRFRLGRRRASAPADAAPAHRRLWRGCGGDSGGAIARTKCSLTLTRCRSTDHPRRL